MKIYTNCILCFLLALMEFFALEFDIIIYITDTHEMSVSVDADFSPVAANKWTPLPSLFARGTEIKTNTFQFTLSSYSVYSFLLYGTFSSVIIAFPHTLANNL